MIDTEITALAREYAEEENPIGSYGDNIVERGMDLSISRDEAERVLTWLTRRFCLVEKSKVEQMYKEAAEGNCKLEKMRPQNTYAKNSIAMRIGVNFGCAHTLKSLFPEIAKEVES